MHGYYSYGSEALYIQNWIIQLIFGIAVAGAVVSLAVSAVIYVFNSLSIYTVARRRCIRSPWMAWLPVIRNWILGSLSDQYQYVVKGKIRYRRYALLAASAVGVLLHSALIALGAEVLTGFLGEFVFGTVRMNMVLLAVFLVVSLAQLGVSVTELVFHYMAMYDVYTSCVARNNVLYLILSLFFRFLEPVFLFVCRNKDEGMPPRREIPGRDEEFADKTEAQPQTDE